MRDRAVLDIDSVVDAIASGKENIDREIVKKELIGLAGALSLPIGLIRADDIVEELIGDDYFVGDAVTGIEKRLQSLQKKIVERPTVQQVILALVENNVLPGRM